MNVYLNEARAQRRAARPFLATALFGPDRRDYWRACLEEAAEPEHGRTGGRRRVEAEAEIADLERRLDRQVLNLEADDVTPALRRRVAERIAELEEAIAERRARLAGLDAEAAAAPPSFAEVAPLLDRLPILAERIADAPETELRALFDALQLSVTYQPEDQALDVALTLYDDGQGDAGTSAQVRAEDWSAPPGGLEPPTVCLVLVARRRMRWDCPTRVPQ